jgi:flagellar biosynthesis protein FlhG
MKTIIPIASGKGGVGKTILSANLGVSLAKAGKTVVLIDLDLGGSNLHTCLGVKNRYPGVGNYIFQRDSIFESLILPMEQPRMFFIPGDSLLPGTANLPYFRKLKILKSINELVADFVLLDLGSGTTYNTVDFALSSTAPLIVITPETTSILNAYSFIKTTLYRLLYRSFPPSSKEREIIQEFLTGKIEGTDTSLSKIVEELREHSSESGRKAEEQLNGFAPRIVLNSGRDTKDIEIGARLRHIVRKNLGIEVEYIGYLKNDPLVPQSLARRKPVVMLNPGSPYSVSVKNLAARIISSPSPVLPMLYEDNEDLISLAEEII